MMPEMPDSIDMLGMVIMASSLALSCWGRRLELSIIRWMSLALLIGLPLFVLLNSLMRLVGPDDIEILPWWARLIGYIWLAFVFAGIVAMFRKTYRSLGYQILGFSIGLIVIVWVCVLLRI